MKILAPGKLILSGEHAVVYGQPALAMAVNRYVTVMATPQVSPTISFNLADLSYQKRFSLAHLHSLKTRIKLKYQRFVMGDFNIRDVLEKPVELAQIAFSLFVETLNLKITQGIKINVTSSIPIGCGMGSSAATILSVVHAIAKHLDMDLPPDVSLQLGLEAENLQHGFSSGLDLKVSLFGGCLYVHEDQMYPRSIPTAPLYLVNTGTPQSSTGECVTAAKKYFEETAIGNDFAAVTNSMDDAIQKNNQQRLMQAIRENHILLTKIGVVPERIENFISEVEAQKGAAKICGAGSVAGDNAGVVLVVTDNPTALAETCDRYHYSLLPIAGESRGVHVV